MNSPQTLVQKYAVGREFPDVALIGRAGAGKTTAATYLDGIGYTRVSFADPIRAISTRLWGAEEGMTRGKLQGIGMKMREIDPDVWVRLMKNMIEQRRAALSQRPHVIDDCRFENEYHVLKELDFIIIRITASRATRIDRLRRNGKLQDEAQLEHVTETSLDHIEPDYTINNDIPNMDSLDTELFAIVNREVERRS